MPWIISNGKSYVEIIGNNQMITTAYIDRAHTFNNKKTAEKYCSLLPKAMKNLKYKVIFISNPNPENPDLQLELLTPEFYLTRLKDFSDFIHTIQSQRETLVAGSGRRSWRLKTSSMRRNSITWIPHMDTNSINCFTMPVCAGASARMQSRGSISS